ncbi:MAG: hypothetical protein V1754_03735, partial [Pseudomonadota bacterium]
TNETAQTLLKKVEDQKTKTTSVTQANPPQQPTTQIRVFQPDDPSATEPIRVRGTTLKTALSLYAQKQWDAACEAMQEHFDNTNNKAPQTNELIQDMRHVGEYITQAQRFLSDDPIQAIGYLKKALEIDRKVGQGLHQSFIRTQLHKTAKHAVVSTFKNRQYARTYWAMEEARKYGPIDPQLQQMEIDLEKRAMDLFTKGYTLRTRSPERAREIWQTVLKMVPPTSVAYQKAASYLQNGPSSYD